MKRGTHIQYSLKNKFVIIPMSINKQCKHNAHMYYMIAESNDYRNEIISRLRDNGIGSAFHYVPLHSSPAGKKFGKTIGS